MNLALLKIVKDAYNLLTFSEKKQSVMLLILSSVALGDRVFKISINQPLSYLHSIDPSEISKKIFKESQRVTGKFFVRIVSVA